jgi:hypothetical protein
MFFRNLFRKKHSVVNHLETPLLRCLNLFDLIFLSVSGMIGTGIYVLSGVVAKDLTGPAIIISNLLAAVACLFGNNLKKWIECFYLIIYNRCSVLCRICCENSSSWFIIYIYL